MLIEENSRLLQSIISQLSLDVPRDLATLTGHRDRILEGLRDLKDLGIISGTFTYSDQRDASGYFLETAQNIVLTNRGALFCRPEPEL